MKKILTLLCVFFLCSAFQCEDEPLEGQFVTAEDALCQQATVASAEAALEFLNAEDANYTQICATYKEALEAQVLACGDEDGSLQEIIDQLGDCALDNDSNCQDLITIKNETEVTFNASTAVNYTENCNALKEAIQNVIDTCGSTAELMDQLEGLGNCILTTTPTASLIGTWRITSLTSNGVEELQDELDAANICFYEEMYTETDLTETEFSGANCDNETVANETGYTFENNTISFSNGDDSVEVIELTEDILRYQDIYTESGETFTDIYTFERQGNITNPNPTNCNGLFMFNTLTNQPIPCDSNFFETNVINNVYIDEIGPTDEDGDGSIDQFKTIIYVTDGTANLDSNNVFVSFEDRTYILALALVSGNTSGFTPGNFEQSLTFEGTYLSLASSDFTNVNCDATTDNISCGTSNSSLIFNGLVTVDDIGANEFDLCFQTKINSAFTNECFNGTFTGVFQPIDVE